MAIINKNRKIVIIAFIIFGILSLSSCKFVIKTFYGIKKPKIETEKSLKKYLKRKGINSNNIYAVSQNDFMQITKQIGGIPEILIFDKNGNNIMYKEEGQCNANAFDFIDNISKDMKFKYNNSLKLDNYISKLKYFNGKPATIDKSKDIDFYLFIFWARYTGRLNKNHVKIWEKLANNNTKCNIKVIKVNLDKQEWW